MSALCLKGYELGVRHSGAMKRRKRRRGCRVTVVEEPLSPSSRPAASSRWHEPPHATRPSNAPAAATAAGTATAPATATTPEVTHEGIFCDGCAARDAARFEYAIVGVRYTRMDSEFDLCVGRLPQPRPPTPFGPSTTLGLLPGAAVV